MISVVIFEWNEAPEAWRDKVSPDGAEMTWLVQVHPWEGRQRIPMAIDALLEANDGEFVPFWGHVSKAVAADGSVYVGVYT